MSITQLEYIVAVATYKSFVAAAEKCNVTQPTLSMQINKLEKEFKVKIFDRSSHPISTTPMGRQLVEQAEIILEECGKMKLILSGNRKSVRKTPKETKAIDSIVKILKDHGLT